MLILKFFFFPPSLFGIITDSYLSYTQYVIHKQILLALSSKYTRFYYFSQCPFLSPKLHSLVGLLQYSNYSPSFPFFFFFFTTISLLYRNQSETIKRTLYMFRIFQWLSLSSRVKTKLLKLPAPGPKALLPSLSCSLQCYLLLMSLLAVPTTHLSFNAVTLDFLPGTLFLQILKGLPPSASSLSSDFTNEPFLNTLFSEILSHSIYHFKKAM